MFPVSFFHRYIFIYILQFKSLRSVRFFNVSKVSYAHEGCIYLIENTVKNSNIVIYSCDGKQQPKGAIHTESIFVVKKARRRSVKWKKMLGLVT